MPASRPAPPPTLQIVTGDSPHALLDRLDADACAHGLSPFDDETIVVQSRGMERWIRQELAVRRGIAAALDVFFPVGFCGRLAAARPADPPDAAFEREALTWRLTTILGELDVHASETWAPLRPYLDGTRARRRQAAGDGGGDDDAGDAAGRFALARRIATLFDNYRLYRPHLLLSWEGEPVPASMRAAVAAADAGMHAPWQRALWQQLTGNARPRHFARWLLETTSWLERATKTPEGLPPCVAVFGISTLPPAFVQLLHALARFVPVTAYVLTPSAHGHADPAQRHPLEAQLGGTSRELLTLLATGDDTTSLVLELPLTGPTTASATAHVSVAGGSTGADTTLARLQTALRGGRAHVEPAVVDVHDRSLLVHDCHSPVRELEVLHDQLLDAFEADPTLRPHDVLVMVPDVDRYASLAAMVFGSGRRDSADAQHTTPHTRPTIPWRVADRAPDRASAPASAFVQLLDLVDSRFHASAVLDLLAGAPVRRAAGLEDIDIDAITRWVQDARIHWGTDGLMRARHGLPSLEEHTWRLGIDRLVAGHATGARDALVLGVLPTAGDTGGDAQALGRFVEWVEQLALRAESLSKPRSLLAWSLAFDAALDWLVKPDGASEEASCARVHADIARLRGRTPDDDDSATPRDTAANDTEVTFDVARRWLLEALASERQDSGFLTGGLTICAMKPMRAIPFRVIAMLGLDDRAFPRRERRPAFDLQGVAPIAGDRDARADDRQLMLDTLLCAGERLHLSWVGRSQANNAAIAPSIVLSELLDQLDVMFRAMQDGAPAPARSQLLVTHALQPFSTSYFDGSAPHRFTFDARWRPPALPEGARAAATVFCTDTATGVPPAIDHPLELTLQDFVDAWADPARWHARHVLRLRLTGVDDGVDDVEPLVVDSLQRTRLLTPMLTRAMRAPVGGADASIETARESMLLANSGDLPPGALTALWTERLHEQRQLIVNEAWRDVPPGGARPPRAVQIRGAGWTITGALDGQVEGGQRFVRGARIGDRERIRAWLQHLVYCASGGTGETRMVGIKTERGVEKADVVRFAFVPDALPQLEVLMRHVRALQHAPLPFFPRAAFAWWSARDNVNAQHDIIEAFTAETMYSSPEAAEPYVALLWRGRSPLEEQWDRFVAITTDLCEPMRAAGGIK